MSAPGRDLDDRCAGIAVLRNELHFADRVLDVCSSSRVRRTSENVLLGAEVGSVILRVVGLLAAQTWREPAPAEDAAICRQQEGIELRECDLGDEVLRRPVLELVYCLVPLADVIDLFQRPVSIEHLVGTPLAFHGDLALVQMLLRLLLVEPLALVFSWLCHISIYEFN